MIAFDAQAAAASRSQQPVLSPTAKALEQQRAQAQASVQKHMLEAMASPTPAAAAAAKAAAEAKAAEIRSLALAKTSMAAPRRGSHERGSYEAEVEAEVEEEASHEKPTRASMQDQERAMQDVREAAARQMNAEAAARKAAAAAAKAQKQLENVAKEAKVKSDAQKISRREGLVLWYRLVGDISDSASESQLRGIFNAMDLNKGGSLDAQEVAKALAKVGYDADDAELAAMMRVADVDAGGDVDYGEFQYLLKEIRAAGKIQSSFKRIVQKREARRAASAKNLVLAAAGADPTTGAESSAASSAVAASPSRGVIKSGLSTTESRPRSGAAPVSKIAQEKAAKAAAAFKARGEYDADAEEPEGVWAPSKWLASLGLTKVITKALKVPARETMEPFNYVRKLSYDDVYRLLADANLAGLTDCLCEGIEQMRQQKASSSAQLNDKFQTSGKFQMSYGSLSLFYGGLESLLGPPQMHKDPDKPEDTPPSLFKAMENEHCANIDSTVEFSSSNGMTTNSFVEWEIVTSPQKKPQAAYPERFGLRESKPEWCRVARPLSEMEEQMEVQCNAKLRKAGHAEMIVEELVAGRLYTGPMYMKYNGVLRSKSKIEFLMKNAKDLCKGNDYVTTIHACNSCVLKLSKLTKAGKVWRGIKDATLPKEFWVPNEMGVRGGIEYGFSSTTLDKSQAVAYATAMGTAHEGDAMTIFEMQMGMVDRGADLTWLSQYPHEKEVLLPPLTGIEALTSDVEGTMLVIHSRLSLNLAAQTLEQVLSRRRKMLMDMATGIELELRDQLANTLSLVPVALKILRKALEYGAYCYAPDWFNSDDNFARIMQETLYLQRTLIGEVRRLDAAMDKPDLNLKGWKARGPARVLLLAGWLFARGPGDVAIDLREAELTPRDGAQLAELMKACPKLTSIDVVRARAHFCVLPPLPSSLCLHVPPPPFLTRPWGLHGVLRAAEQRGARRGWRGGARRFHGEPESAHGDLRTEITHGGDSGALPPRRAQGTPQV